ncbi:MAG: hypothetical protein DF280_03095 ['Brassica napus' phytoplasma]|nr:MAG: hypothetical protein DF280_03095 ['Brassica napus' phytoplasma]
MIIVTPNLENIIFTLVKIFTKNTFFIYKILKLFKKKITITIILVKKQNQKKKKLKSSIIWR